MNTLWIVLKGVGVIFGWLTVYNGVRWLWRRKPWRRAPKAPPKRLLYVAAWGDDDKNPGTNELPFRTHERAFREKARDGDVIEVHLAEGLHPLDTMPVQTRTDIYIAPGAPGSKEAPFKSFAGAARHVGVPTLVAAGVPLSAIAESQERERVTKRQGKTPRSRGAHKRAMKRLREQESLEANYRKAAEKGFPVKQAAPAPKPIKCSCWHPKAAHSLKGGCLRPGCVCRATQEHCDRLF